MIKRLLPVVAAAAAFALPASAATTITITPTPNPCGAMDLTCTYSVAGNITNSGAFSGSSTFVVPSAGTASSVLSSVRLSATTDVDFGTVQLMMGMTTYTFSILNDFVIPGAPATDYAVLDEVSLSPGTYTLMVSGTTGSQGGSFGGNIDFAAAVPEVSTWALMILGFGVVGGALRRSKVRPALRYA